MLEFLKHVKFLSRCAEYLTQPIEWKAALLAPVLTPMRSTQQPTSNLATVESALRGKSRYGTDPDRSATSGRPLGNRFAVSVCGEEEVPSFHEAGVTDLLTCVSPERPVFRPAWPGLRYHLIVRCDDVEEPADDFTCPSEEHVQQIIQFGQQAIRRSQQGSPVHLLIHCAAGISRSTAAALLVLSMKLGKGVEAVAMRELTSMRPICRPNAAIVAHGDRLLGREGRLIHEVDLWKAQHHTVAVDG